MIFHSKTHFKKGRQISDDLSPPFLSLWILKTLLVQYSEIPAIGDLTEEYSMIYEEEGKKSACRWYRKQIMRSVPFALKQLLYWSFIMIGNYLKVALRHIKKHRVHAFLNILGLATGITCCLFIMLYVRFEQSFDTFHPDADRIFRVTKSLKTEGKHDRLAANVMDVAPTLKERFPEVVASARAANASHRYYRVGNETYLNEKMINVDPEIFDIMDIPFIIGDPKAALERPNSIVLTKHMAKKYFGDSNPMGKIVTGDTVAYEVTGVVENCRRNSHLQFDLIGRYVRDTNSQWYRPWGGYHGMNYIKLTPDVDVQSFQEKIRLLPHEYIGERLQEQGAEFALILQPITSIHLHSHLDWEWEAPGNPIYVTIFTAVAVLILLVASMNFMNLTTARSANRAGEVGLRKVVGAHRRQLIGQFMGESLATAFIAVLLAILFVSLLLPRFNDITGMSFSYTDIWNWDMLSTVMIMLCVIGLAAGCYPAIFLSAFRPTTVLQGVLKEGSKSAVMRKILVTGQFSISIILIIGAILFGEQLAFMKNQYLGFDKSQKLIIEFDRKVITPENAASVRNEFLRHPGIQSAAFSSSVPGRWMYYWRMRPSGIETNSQMINAFQVDENFFKDYQIQFISGRGFEPEMNNRGWVVNETAVQVFGWETPENALTQYISRETSPILGVMKDFHFRGLQSNVEPLAIFMMSEDYRYLTLTVDTHQLESIISSIDEAHDRLFPHALYDYFFLDEDFNTQYQSEERLSRIFGIFTFLGIFIACLGLFGLASFVAEQRTKEIGIRKVLGASVSTISLMLSKEFGVSVLLANLIAWPLAYWGVQKWLDNFAYRIGINVFPFILSSILALLIAMMTISWQTVKAGKTNPVDALKCE